MGLPADYAQRVYAGVLGKLIGVYLGRPFEGWPYRAILEQLGTITGYVHERLRKPLIVSDDDITGTFTFVRALEDHAESGAAITAEEIGQTWLNYIIEKRTILWWGGMGMSTEHTAFLRLQRGTPAPHSGSAALNGRLVAQQIGAQIFIDGWAMVSPGDPEQAAALARRAASVSHDGEAIYAAQVVAVMEALAFVESDLNRLLDEAVRHIPADSLIARLISDLRALRAKEPDWQRAMTELVEKRYGYDQYAGGCHVIPNHALIILALLWGEDDFGKSLMIVNTLGWDTDCNSGNVGCLLGIKNGLAAIGSEWRDPVADRLFLPTADGGRCFSDALSIALEVENTGRQLAGVARREPKDGARFHFSMPGSVQGFTSDDGLVENAGGQLRFSPRGEGESLARASTATFIPPDYLSSAGTYDIVGSPTLYPMQVLTADVAAPATNAAPITAALFLAHYNDQDQLQRVEGPGRTLSAGQSTRLKWEIPETDNQPIAQIGIATSARSPDALLVDRMAWSGTPKLVLAAAKKGGTVWTRAWTNGVSNYAFNGIYLRLIQNSGRGLLMYGTRDWTDYSVRTSFDPVLARSVGLAGRVGGLRRYYAALLHTDGVRRTFRLIKMRDRETILAEQDFDWAFAEPRELQLSVKGSEIAASVDGKVLLRAKDEDRPMPCGGIGLVVEEGRVHAGPVHVEPL